MTTGNKNQQWDTAQQAYWEKQDRRRRPDHPVIAAFAEPKVRHILDVLGRDHPANKPAQILDVGCGNGYFTWQLAKHGEVVGLDFSSVMLRQNPCRPLVCGSATGLPFGDDAFDLVLCSNLLHHLDDPVAAVREMARTSRGHVALSEPNCRHPAMALFHGLAPQERGALKFSPRYLKRVMQDAGLRVLTCSAQGSVLPNKCPPSLLPLFRPLDRVPLCRLYCVGVGAVGG